MIRTNDAVAAMLFMVHARRLGLEPVAMEDGRGWALETARGREVGEALWGLLEQGSDNRSLTHLVLQEFIDERNSFHAAHRAEAEDLAPYPRLDAEEQLDSLAAWHLDAAAAWRDGLTLSDKYAEE